MSLSAPVRDEMLLPCPFCGVEVRRGTGFPMEPPYFEHETSACVLTNKAWHYDGYTAAWNTRTPASQVEAETYRQMHETAKELGYPSILEALEATPPARKEQP